MGKYKHYKGSIGGGVDISGKSKMSGKAKSLMSFPGGIPGPGEYGKMEQPTKIVGKGMASYLAGESVGMRKMDPMYNGKPGVQQDDFEQFGTPKSTGPSKSGGPAKPEKKLPTYDQAYDAQSDEKKKTQSREQFKTEAKAYNKKKYGTTEPSKDSSEAGLKRKDLAENKKTKKKTTSFDGSGSNKKKGEDKKEGKKRVVAKDADASTRKGRKAMKDADKKSGDSRKEVKSRKLQRKAGAAEGDKKARLEARVKRRKERLAKKKK